jgi:hypothetical protein
MIDYSAKVFVAVNQGHDSIYDEGIEMSEQTTYDDACRIQREQGYDCVRRINKDGYLLVD